MENAPPTGPVLVSVCDLVSMTVSTHVVALRVGSPMRGAMVKISLMASADEQLVVCLKTPLHLEKNKLQLTSVTRVTSHRALSEYLRYRSRWLCDQFHGGSRRCSSPPRELLARFASDMPTCSACMVSEKSVIFSKRKPKMNDFCVKSRGSY